MKTPPPAVVLLGELVRGRLAQWGELSLATICKPPDDFAELGAELTAHLLAQRLEIAGWIREVASHPRGQGWEQNPVVALRAGLVRWLRVKNQFFVVDEKAADQLDRLYQRSLLDVAQVLSSPTSASRDADALRNVVETHRAVIASLIRSRLGPSPRDVVCSEYSAVLQLEVLGLGQQRLAEPILDVGCGPKAALVRFLVGGGQEVQGIDRDVESDAELPVGTLSAEDWLTFPFGKDRWGTIVSHLGFSLHFLHFHFGQDALAYDFAKVYMAMLKSLRVGGVFAYAPALPFMEALLPAATYRCETLLLPPELAKMAPPVQKEAATALGRASHVRRLA